MKTLYSAERRRCALRCTAQAGARSSALGPAARALPVVRLHRLLRRLDALWVVPGQTQESGASVSGTSACGTAFALAGGAMHIARQPPPCAAAPHHSSHASHMAMKRSGLYGCSHRQKLRRRMGGRARDIRVGAEALVVGARARSLATGLCSRLRLPAPCRAPARHSHRHPVGDELACRGAVGEAREVVVGPHLGQCLGEGREGRGARCTPKPPGRAAFSQACLVAGNTQSPAPQTCAGPSCGAGLYLGPSARRLSGAAHLEVWDGHHAALADDRGYGASVRVV